jgi:hypothetical protein
MKNILILATLLVSQMAFALFKEQMDVSSSEVGMPAMVAINGQPYQVPYSQKDLENAVNSLMTEGRRIRKEAETTYIVAIENHPEVRAAQQDIQERGARINRSGVTFDNRHLRTVNALRLAQMAIAKNQSSIDEVLNASKDLSVTLIELRIA